MSRQNNYFTVQEALDSIEKFGYDNILTCFLYEEDWTKEKMGEHKFRDNKKNKKKNDCTWVPLRFKHCDGSLRRVNLKINKVLTTSKAKMPAKVDPETAKYLHIAFKKLTLNEIRGGDFVPREMNDAKEQLKENERVENNINLYKKSTDDFNDVCLAIDASYKRIAEDLKTRKTRELGFKVKKGQGNVTIFSIVQTTILDQETEEERELEQPIIRVRLTSGRNTRKIGTEVWNNDTKSWVFKPNVLDVRKMTKKTNFKPVLAKVRVGKKLKPLDLDNAGSFITYKSLIGGTIEFPEMVISTFGISLTAKFGHPLGVRRHKTKLSEPAFTVKDLEDLNDGELSDSDDEDAILEESEEKDYSDTDSNLDDSDEDEDEDED